MHAWREPRRATEDELQERGERRKRNQARCHTVIISFRTNYNFYRIRRFLPSEKHFQIFTLAVFEFCLLCIKDTREKLENNRKTLREKERCEKRNGVRKKKQNVSGRRLLGRLYRTSFLIYVREDNNEILPRGIALVRQTRSPIKRDPFSSSSSSAELNSTEEVKTNDIYERKRNRERKRGGRMETRVGEFGGAVLGTGDAVHDVRIPKSRTTAT